MTRVEPSQYRRLGLVERKNSVGKHRSKNDAHLRALIDRLDKAGDIEAADTIAGLVWNLDLLRMQYERDAGPMSRLALRGE